MKRSLRFAIDAAQTFSWAVAFLGFIIGFYIFSSFGFLLGIACGFLSTLPGLLILFLVEFYLLEQQKYQEIKKQTHILEELKANLS